MRLAMEGMGGVGAPQDFLRKQDCVKMNPFFLQSQALNGLFDEIL